MTKKQRDRISKLAQRHLVLQLEDDPKATTGITFWVLDYEIDVFKLDGRWCCRAYQRNAEDLSNRRWQIPI